MCAADRSVLHGRVGVSWCSGSGTVTLGQPIGVVGCGGRSLGAVALHCRIEASGTTPKKKGRKTKEEGDDADLP